MYALSRALSIYHRMVLVDPFKDAAVEVGDLGTREVSAGDVVLIPPSCRQRITNAGPGDLIFLAICTPRFRPEVYEDIDDPT